VRFVPGLKGLSRGLALPGPVRPFLVVVADATVNLGLGLANGVGGGLFIQEPLEGLVLVDDEQLFEFGLENCHSPRWG
jgi:hypothetical protein